MQHWFVYYKLDAAAARDLEPRLRHMLGEVAAATGARARLMRRIDDTAAMTTLLEVYEDIERPQDFASALDAAVAHAGLPAPLVAQRRAERFGDL